MEQKDIMNKFNRLYSRMSTSNKPRYIHIFGETMRCMMEDMVGWNPEAVKEYLDKLEAIDWCNYLSKKEAMEIVDGMEPKGAWNISDWMKLMDSNSLCLEDEPHYNKWALHVTMNMIYSDSGSTIAKIAGHTLSDISEKELFSAIYMLALDKLRDKDGMFDIRSYFHV